MLIFFHVLVLIPVLVAFLLFLVILVLPALAVARDWRRRGINVPGYIVVVASVLGQDGDDNIAGIGRFVITDGWPVG